MTKTISVVLPVYNCSPCLKLLTARLIKVLKKISPRYEIIFVNDGSTDNSWQMIKLLSAINPHVKGLDLSRNFGQHYAITAGLDIASGRWVVVMDADLQDRPEDILKLYQKATAGYAAVWAKRVERHDWWGKRLVSQVFHRLFGYLSGLETDPTVGNFSICSSRLIGYVREMREQNRSYLQAVKWLGFRQGFVSVVHDKRFAGPSTYTLVAMLRYAFDSVLAYSDKPLKLAIFMGFLFAGAAFIYGFYLVYRYFSLGELPLGWTSVMVSLYFLAGLLFVNLGFIGLYIGKIFAETKNRPLYIVEERVGKS